MDFTIVYGKNGDWYVTTKEEKANEPIKSVSG